MSFLIKMKIKAIVLLCRLCSGHRHVSSSEKLYSKSWGWLFICLCRCPWNWPCVSHCWQLGSPPESLFSFLFLPALFALRMEHMPAFDSRSLPSVENWNQQQSHALKHKEWLGLTEELLCVVQLYRIRGASLSHCSQFQNLASPWKPCWH